MANKGSLLQELIRKKRDGDSLTDQEIEAFVEGVVDQSASDGHWRFCDGGTFERHVGIRMYRAVTFDA